MRLRGAQLVENMMVSGFAMSKRQIRGARTNAGDVEGDVFCRCSGGVECPLAGSIGGKSHLQPGKAKAFRWSRAGWLCTQLTFQTCMSPVALSARG